MGKQQMAERIELWPIERLIPYARNARVHSQQQIDAIARSIRELGFNNPILVDGNDGILAGHGRLEAAIQVGMKEVPVVPLQHLTEAQRKAYILVDNRTAEMARWDDGLLAAEIQRLEREFEMDFDGLGWTAEELDDLNAAMDEALDVTELPPVLEREQQPDEEPTGDGEAGVIRDSSYNEFLDRYKDKTTRALMLEYPVEQFEKLVGYLATLREQYNVDNNAEAVWLLIEETVGNA